MSLPQDVASRRRPSIVLGVLVAFGLLVSGLISPSAAFAAESSLRIDKRVDDLDVQDTLIPGDEFIYTIDLACDDVDCVNVQVTDTLPAELAGFEFVGTSYSPATLPLTVSTAGCVEEGGVPVEVSENCTVTVVFQQPVDGGIGLEAGGTLKLSLALRAPLDLPADWAYNGETVTNTASHSPTGGELPSPRTKDFVVLSKDSRSAPRAPCPKLEMSESSAKTHVWATTK